jgi:CyaY protein
MSNTTVERKDFSTKSTLALEHLDEVLGDLEHERLDVDLAGDVLTLAFDDGGKFIINAHSAAGQIWLAAGTEAWHFDYLSEEDRWVASKQGDELRATVARVVSQKLGETVQID